MLAPVVQRFLRYVQIDTQSDPESTTTPSTERQKNLGRLLVEELREMGLSDVEMDENGYVYAFLPAQAPQVDMAQTSSHADMTLGSHVEVGLGLLAHLDTSPDEPGAARPVVHFDYDGSVIELPGDRNVKLDPSQRPELLRHIGDHVITSDGRTLLGSDDKAGVAVLMQLAEDLLGNPAPRPPLHICFTVDEEIGRGVDHLDLERFTASVAYTIDGSGLGTLYGETFNAARATISVDGVMVHPGYAKGLMVNALRILADLIARLPGAESPEHTSGREGYIHPHRMTDGDTAHASLQLILRDFTDEGLERRKRLLKVLVDGLQIEYPRARISLSIEDEYRNMRSYIEESDPRVLAFAHAAAREIGLELEERIVRGGTDGARLSEMGIPTPNIFNGGHDYHSRFEWNTAGSIELSLKYVKALVAYWGTHS